LGLQAFGPTLERGDRAVLRDSLGSTLGCPGRVPFPQVSRQH
jgi:hypothetical protein